MRLLSKVCLSLAPHPGPASSSTSISTICSMPLTTRGTLIFFFGLGDGDGCGCCCITFSSTPVILLRQQAPPQKPSDKFHNDRNFPCKLHELQRERDLDSSSGK